MKLLKGVLKVYSNLGSSAWIYQLFWQATMMILSLLFSYRKIPTSRNCCENSANIEVLFILRFYLPTLYFASVRFTTDVKIKSICIIGGIDGSSPSKMRA